MIVIFCILSLACLGILAGCGKQKTEDQRSIKEEKEEIEKEKEEKEELKLIGNESEGENIYKVTLENNTGKDIVGISVKDSSQETYPENMLSENDRFVKNERRYLFYDANTAIKVLEDQQVDSGQPILDPQFDIQLTFEDQTALVLTAFPFDDIKEGKICLQDGVAFVEYESIVDNQKVSTKEAELNLKAQAEAEAAAKAQAEAEAAAKAQAEAEAAAKAQAEAEAAAAAQAQQWQQQQSSSSASSSDSSQGCVGNDADFW